MKFLILLLFPSISFGQPKKAFIYSVARSLNDTRTWSGDEPLKATVTFTNTYIKVDTTHYKIDSAKSYPLEGSYVYHLSHKNNRYYAQISTAKNRGAKEWVMVFELSPGVWNNYWLNEDY
jgi:hypothetical protein